MSVDEERKREERKRKNRTCRKIKGRGLKIKMEEEKSIVGELILRGALDAWHKLQCNECHVCCIRKQA